MLVDSDYIKYDKTLEEYYINIDCITNYTDYDSHDLELKGISDKTLKILSHNVYRLIYDYRRRDGKYTHKQYMRKKIYDNTMEEVNALMNAMIEVTKGAIESGMDLNAYIDEPKDTFPFTAIQELRSADLLDSSEKIDNGDLDITYTLEDDLIAT